MKHLQEKIIENKKVAKDFYKMRIESSYLGKNSKPGQFVEVRCSDKNDPLLRRPLGVHRISKNGIEMLYEVVGKGTELLSKKKAGEVLDIIGPLGSGFDLSLCAKYYVPSTILIAGGIGVAPLVALAEELRRKRKDTIVIIGAKTKSHIMCEEEFKSLGCAINVATEDGSKGKKGLATDLLIKALNQPTSQPANQQTIIYACGPIAMLKVVAKVAEGRGIQCQVSLEERMACGVGVCLGCPVKVNWLTGSLVRGLKPANQLTSKPANHTYKMVCKDGPVFDAQEIAW